jgi:anti-sigma regulatory factor (Ser/Thr protein kinase)
MPGQQIEVEFRYEQRQFRLLVRDDGKGIEATFLTAEGVQGTSAFMACASAPS